MCCLRTARTDTAARPIRSAICLGVIPAACSRTASAASIFRPAHAAGPEHLYPQNLNRLRLGTNVAPHPAQLIGFSLCEAAAHGREQ